MACKGKETIKKASHDMTTKSLKAKDWYDVEQLARATRKQNGNVLMDTLGIEPRASRMLSGCDTTTPCAHYRSSWIIQLPSKAPVTAEREPDAFAQNRAGTACGKGCSGN